MAEQRRVRAAAATGAAASTPTAASAAIPDFSKESEVYDDACDFGQFMLNPCLYIFNSLMRCAKRMSLKSALGHLQKCDEIASAHVQQVIYCLAVFGSWSIVFIKVYPLCRQSSHLADYHTYIGYFVFLFCVGSWRFACGVDPGNITEQTLQSTMCIPTMTFCTPTRCVRRSRYASWHVANTTNTAIGIYPDLIISVVGSTNRLAN